jgi:hypothetical protein
VASQFPSGAPVDLHFIGHSEGAVVNTQAIVQLQTMMTPALKAGYVQDTLLDPHAANNAIPGQQYSLGNGAVTGFLSWIAKGEIDSFQSRAKDPPVFVPPGVNQAEVFYQHTTAQNSHSANSDIYNLWGQVPIKGPAFYFNLTAAGATHAGKTGVAQWYADFIAPTLGDQAPLVQSLRLTVQIDHTGAGATAAAGPISGAGPVTHDRKPEFSGTAAPSSTVRLYVAPAASPSRIKLAGSTRADAQGRWNLIMGPQANGRYRAVVMAFSRASRTRSGLTIVPTVPLGRFEVRAQPR